MTLFSVLGLPLSHTSPTCLELPGVFSILTSTIISFQLVSELVTCKYSEKFCVIRALLVHTNSLLFCKVEDILHDSTYWISCAPFDKFYLFLTLAYCFVLFVE